MKGLPTNQFYVLSGYVQTDIYCKNKNQPDTI